MERREFENAKKIPGISSSRYVHGLTYCTIDHRWAKGGGIPTKRQFSPMANQQTTDYQKSAQTSTKSPRSPFLDAFCGETTCLITMNFFHQVLTIKPEEILHLRLIHTGWYFFDVASSYYISMHRRITTLKPCLLNPKQNPIRLPTWSTGVSPKSASCLLMSSWARADPASPVAVRRVEACVSHFVKKTKVASYFPQNIFVLHFILPCKTR